MNLIYLVVFLTIGLVKSKLSRQELRWFIDQNFQELDKDKDGILELNEFTSVVRKDDSNHDGIYTCDEYSKFTGEARAISIDIFNHLDSNSDCSMSHQEWIALYHRIDGSGDGIVTRQEYDNFMIEIMMHLGHNVVINVPSGTQPN